MGYGFREGGFIFEDLRLWRLEWFLVGVVGFGGLFLLFLVAAVWVKLR